MEFASAPVMVPDLDKSIWFFGVGKDNNLYYHHWDLKLPVAPFTWASQGSILLPGVA